jgi:predicted XRE-type DNA-binding protein
MKAISYFHLSKKNKKYSTQLVEVANGVQFQALKLSKEEISKATNVLYIHVNRLNKQCYVGITEQEAWKRWFCGLAYKNNRRFGAAIRKYEWAQFDSYILAFGESRESLNQAEKDAIAVAGGHKSKHTYNLSPGGDMVAENDIPIVGVNLETRESQKFKSGSDAARKIGLKSTDMPMAVARGERTSVANWWFRYETDIAKQPPTIWGNKLRILEIQKKQSKNLIATSFETNEQRRYKTLEEAAKDLDVTKSLISMVARGKSTSANGWWIQFEGSKKGMPKTFGSALRREKRDEKVYAVNLSSRVRKEFRNCTIADAELGLYKGAAASVASGQRASAAGWWFTLKKSEKPPTKVKGALVAEARSKPIYAIELATGKESRFDSAKQAEEALGIHRSTISNIIKGKSKSSKGYSFRFA